MGVKNRLTNELLRDRFDNPFALVNYAITLAKQRIHRGEGIDSNPINEVLDDIANRDDILGEEDDSESEEDLNT